MSCGIMFKKIKVFHVFFFFYEMKIITLLDLSKLRYICLFTYPLVMPTLLEKMGVFVHS